MPEPEIWPIGKAFACFVNGYVFKPVPKWFSYHGMGKICTKLGKMKQFECRRFNPMEEWVLIHDFDFNGWGDWFWYYTVPSEYLPSDQLDVCTDKWVDGFVRYYFAQVKVNAWDPPHGIKFYYSNGLNCRNWEFYLYGNGCYKAWFDYLWVKSPTLFAVWGSGYGSHAKIWASKTGNLPDYYPVPEEEVIG